jgi:hypothetical protein
MDETIPCPQAPSNTLEEQAAEFLELLLRVSFEIEKKDEE